MATLGPATSWQHPGVPNRSDPDVDWPVVIVAILVFAMLAIGIGIYVYPSSESGRFDRCVQQRVDMFLEKVHFPVIPAVSECTELRDQGALAN